MKRNASSIWKGSGAEGSGSLTTQSGVLQSQPYSFRLRFENEDGKQGTNPEELIAAAQAGCFNMALAIQIDRAGFTANELSTEAIVTLDKLDAGGFAITKVHLELEASIPGIDSGKFEELANNAKEGCPVSQVLNADISMDARLI